MESDMVSHSKRFPKSSWGLHGTTSSEQMSQKPGWGFLQLWRQGATKSFLQSCEPASPFLGQVHFGWL